MSSARLKSWIDTFWIPLITAARESYSTSEKRYYLIAFFVDDFGKSRQYDFEYEEKRLQRIFLPLKLPTIENFSEDLIEDWYEKCRRNCRDKKRDFNEFENLNIQDVLHSSEGGVPEFVYEDISKQCGYSWDGDNLRCQK